MQGGEESSLQLPFPMGDLKRWIISNLKKERGRVAECGDATTAMRHKDQSVGVCSLRKTRANRKM